MHSYSSTTFIFIDCTAHSCRRKISTLANRIGLSEAMAVKIMSAITEHSRNDKQGFFNGVFDLSHDCSLGHVTHNDFTGRSEPKKKEDKSARDHDKRRIGAFWHIFYPSIYTGRPFTEVTR